jgi:hypothetical protein
LENRISNLTTASAELGVKHVRRRSQRANQRRGLLPGRAWCPEHIHITDNAIIPLKERVVDRFYDLATRLLRMVTG